MQIAILGFGASAMFSIMACNSKGIKPIVISKEYAKPSIGAFYFHWLPADYSDLVEPEIIQYQYMGTEEQYLKKQWGDFKVTSSSFNKYDLEKGYDPAEVFSVFSLRAKYSCILKQQITYGNIVNYCSIYDLVICTFPVAEFLGEPKIVKRPVLTKNTGVYENTILYNGCEKPNWVRRSTLFGKVYTEYATFEDVPEQYRASIKYVPDIHPYSKPKKQFETPMDNLIFTGRFATINRSMLAHEAYYQTESAINAI